MGKSKAKGTKKKNKEEFLDIGNSANYDIGTIVKPKFRTGKVNQTKTAKTVSVNKDMITFLVDRVEEDKPFVITWRKEHEHEGEKLVLIRLDGDTKHVWVASDFEATGKKAEDKDIRAMRLNALAERENISPCREEVVEALAEKFMEAFKEIHNEFGGIGLVEVADAMAEVFAAAKMGQARQKMGDLGDIVGKLDSSALKELFGGGTSKKDKDKKEEDSVGRYIY